MASTGPSAFRGIYRSDDAARAVYSEAAGIARIMPSAVAVPADADDLAELVRWAAATRTPLIPRGSGSSMAGGAVGTGVIVDVSRFRDLGSADAARRAIRAGAGVLRVDVDNAARAAGLRLPVDPSSGAFCTVGGMVSTNAAGAHSLHFGPMRPWVRALDCVFADGSRAEVRRGGPPPRGVPAVARFLDDAELLVANERAAPSVHTGVRKESSGYAMSEYARSGELVDLLVGSEGTLAFFVDVEIGLAPTAASTSSVLGAFASLEQAMAAAVGAKESGAVACELLDRTFLDVAAAGGHRVDVPGDTECVLLAEVEGENANDAATSARHVESAFREAGATTVRVALDPVTETELWELRHAASPILSQLDPSLASMQFIEDAAVPPDRVPEYIRGVRAALARYDTRGVIFGHAGDAHVHVNPLVDVRLAGWRDRVWRLLDEVTALAASLGGTLTGEHGDGRLRTPLLGRVWNPAATASFAAVKQCFDPHGILNPGVKVALRGQNALSAIKYDPALAPLESSARAALDRVARDRAYGRFRLELLDAPT
jgi:FAD/FMN-containing dehydrogenase